ncbi:MAG: hypothetical protein IKI95_05090 [Clostridia bacterium]|nr:hypothetical protein [Clostridia bacterium]
MWIVLIGLAIVSLASILVCCKAASDADDITEDWNKNWIGQKFTKEAPKSKK